MNNNKKEETESKPLFCIDLVRIRKSLLSSVQVFIYSSLVYLSLSAAYAAPNGGNIVGGSGSISSNGLTTNINQLSSSMAIDWNSYNLNSTEIVNYLQPDTSAISLNRILGGDASKIHGQINANGQVVLVNPNGIFFGQNASINVGGLIASGLDIDPVDFMNGDYIFKEVIGSDGTVFNSGLINASLGGSVTLLGKQVKNDGVINARLGAVNMAAGKEAVLTFEGDGLIGVRVSKEILQDELGINEAVINSGEINAKGGRVLLTASVSRDVFSEAVNHEGLQQATSVVVNEDGSFSLGGGADVLNSGAVNVSGHGLEDAGRVVMLGENIIHTGTIKANAESGLSGMVELHAMDKTELKGDALISAQATLSGSGGQIKLLGDKIGLFDTAEVNASGINGGGEVLVGGDRQGLNSNVRNAEFLYLEEGSNINADAIENGDGGRVITYANDTGRFHGGLYARGGALGGNGGFIETSAKKGFEIPVAPDVSAVAGQGGLWLIDPYDITIVNGDGSGTSNIDLSGTPYFSDGTPAVLEIDTILAGLAGGDVEIQTVAGDGGVENGDIIFDAVLDYDGTGTNTLTLNADGGITFTGTSSIGDGDNSDDSLNLILYANDIVALSAFSSIDTQGGDFTVGGGGGNTPTSFTNNGSIDTTGRDDTSGGNVSITSSGIIDTNALSSNGGAATGDNNGTDAGSITLVATGAVTVNGDLLSIGSDGNDSGGGSEQWPGGAGGSINITSDTSTVDITGDINSSGGDADGDGGEDVNGGDAGNVTLSSQAGAGTITLDGNILSAGGAEFGGGTAGNKPDIILDGNVTLVNALTLDVNSFSSGDINATGAADSDGNDIDITTENNLSTGSITTIGGIATGVGQAGGTVDLISSSGNITVSGAINSNGSNGAAINNDGGDAGSVTLGADGQLSVGAITASGGLLAGTGADGDSADIDLTTNTGTMTLQGNLLSLGNGTSNITVDSGDDVLLQSLTISANNNASLDANGNNIDYDGVGAGGFLVISAANNVALSGDVTDTVADTDQLTVILTADNDSSGNGNVDINASIATNGSNFTVTGDDYDAQSIAGGGTKFTVNTGSGNADINVTGTVVLGEMVVGGTLDIVGGGNITQGAANNDTDDLVVTGTTTITATGNNITFDNENDFSNITLIGDDVAVEDINAIVLNGTGLGTAVTGTLDVLTSGNITQSGGQLVIAGGATSLDAGTGDITLLDINNSFASIGVSGSNVSLFDVGAIVLDASDVTGNFNVTANGGNITQTDAITGDSNASFIATANNISLANLGNDFSTVSASAVNVDLGDTDDIDLGASTITGTLDITADNAGSISQNGTVTVTGISTLDAGGDITLADGNNNFSTVVVAGATNVSLADIDGIILGASNITNTFDVTANGAGTITQSGDLSIGGDATFTATGDLITLANANNNFATVGANGLDVILQDNDNIDLGASTITGTLDVTASNAGNITQSGAVSVTGLTTLDATGDDITLANNSNNFSTVIVSGLNVDISDVNSIIIGASTITGTLDVTANGAGNITQSGVLDVTGLTTLTALGNNITFNNVLNDFSAVSTSAANVDLQDVNDIDLGISSITGTLDVEANNGGDISQSGALAVTGDASFLVNAGQSITLGDTSNNFEGSLSFASNTAGDLLDVSVANNGALNLGTITVSRHLSIDANGAITDSGVLSVGGVMGVDANGNSVLLNSATSNFNDLVIVDASSATVVDANELNIGSVDGTSSFANTDSNVTGNLSITTLAGNLTDEDSTALNVGGVANLDVAGDITLDSSTNNFNTVNIVDGQNVTLEDTNSINLQSSNIAGDLSVSANGNIGSGGALSVTGSSSFIAAANGDIELDDANNELAGSLSFDSVSGNLSNINLANTVATNIDGLTVNNDLTIDSGGEITQNGAFNVGNLTTLTAAGQDINLDQSNNLNELSIVTASNAVVDNGSNNLQLNQLVVDNELRLEANSLIDNNGNGNNLQAGLLTIRTSNGIGNGNELESQVALMDVINSGAGDIRFDQTGDVEFLALQNATSTGTVSMESNGDYYFNPGSVDANRDQGTLTMTTSGDFFGVGGFDLNNADITAFSATFISPTGNFGTPGRPIILNVPTSGNVFIQTRTTSVDFFPETPTDLVSEGIDLSILGSVAGIAGDQLVEIESLSNIDPAIFTALSNYNQEETAIRMPRDQLYEDELESSDTVQ